MYYRPKFRFLTRLTFLWKNFWFIWIYPIIWIILFIVLGLIWFRICLVMIIFWNYWIHNRLGIISWWNLWLNRNTRRWINLIIMLFSLLIRWIFISWNNLSSTMKIWCTLSRIAISWPITQCAILLLPLTFAIHTIVTNTLWINVTFVRIRILDKNTTIGMAGKPSIAIQARLAIFTSHGFLITQTCVAAKVVAVTRRTCGFLVDTREIRTILIIWVTVRGSLETIGVWSLGVVTNARITDVLFKVILATHLWFTLHTASTWSSIL